MKRLSKLTQGIIATFAILPIVGFGAVPVLAYTGQSSNGQFTGIYEVKDETTNGAYGNTITANACDDLRYKVYLYNPGPSFLSNATVQATLPKIAAKSNTSTVTASSVNAEPSSISLTSTVNFASAQSVTYQSGSTELLDANGNLIKDLPDGITQGGVNIGDLAASGTEFVQFGAQVNCPTPPTPPKPPKPPVTPTYACTELGLAADVNRTVKISSFSTTQTNGAVFSHAVINWGDNSTALVTANAVGQTHQYAANGTYTVTATAHFTVNGQDVTAGGIQCEQQVTFSSTTPPTVTPPATTPPAPTAAAPTALVNTGPGSVIGMFVAATAIGTFIYHRYLTRRLTRQ